MTMLPAATDFTGAPITEGQFKTAMDSLRAFLYEKLGSDGSVAIQAFATGTLMLFQQTAAPTGWTKQTTHNDKALRVVSGTASSGGSSAFSTVFGKTATDAHTLTAAQIPAHTHPLNAPNNYGSGISQTTLANSIPEYIYAQAGAVSYAGIVALGDRWGAGNNTGGGGSHSHNIDIRVQYVDLIIAAKD